MPEIALDRNAGGTRSRAVDHACTGGNGKPVAGGANAHREVRIFPIHEEILVEKSGPDERVGADQDRCRRHPAIWVAIEIGGRPDRTATHQPRAHPTPRMVVRGVIGVGQP